ncbi:MAG: hypothetical protein ND895_24655 [Pyrinomonadaceae bacterium]|nr:hypothetical protein [Pyrinomonadaceae bacterium]
MNQLTTVLAALPLLMAIFAQGDSCGSVKQESNNTKDVAVQQEGRMIKGTWGGDHISMEVTEEGAQIEFDCAHGIVSEPLRVDGQGKFRASGTHFKESAGPQRADDEDKGVPVIYSGTTDGKTATFKITNSATDEVIGTFSLTLGKRSRIHKCL